MRKGKRTIMKIVKMWVEYEDDQGSTYLRPATGDDLDYFKYRPVSEASKEPRAGARLSDSKPDTGQEEVEGFPLWTPGPGYSQEEIEALRFHAPRRAKEK